MDSIVRRLERTFEHRIGIIKAAIKDLADGLQCEPAGGLAARVSTHSVGDHQQPVAGLILELSADVLIGRPHTTDVATRRNFDTSGTVRVHCNRNDDSEFDRDVVGRGAFDPATARLWLLHPDQGACGELAAWLTNRLFVSCHDRPREDQHRSSYRDLQVHCTSRN